LNEDKFNKYPKIKAVGSPENTMLLKEGTDIEITEKVDGANFRFMVRDGKLIFGSRNLSLGNEDNDIGGNWKRCVDFIKEKHKAHPLREGFIYYGECVVKHSIDYDWDKIPPFLGFGVYSFEQGFLPNWNAYFTASDIPIINVIYYGEYTGEELLKIPEKSAYSSTPPEGIVIKNYFTTDEWNNVQWGKIVSEKFKEVNRDTFGASKKYASDDDELLIAKYCTNPRIDKTIFKLLDEGHELKMELMHHLPKKVWQDIVEEEGKEILMTKWKLNLDTVQKLVSKRCVNVLKQVMVNTALNN